MLKFSKKVPLTFYGLEYIQAALDRAAMSYYRHHGSTSHFDAHTPIQHARQRMKWFTKTGNKEWLVDAINFLLRELQVSQHPKLHWDKAAQHPEDSLWKRSGKGRGDDSDRVRSSRK